MTPFDKALLGALAFAAGILAVYIVAIYLWSCRRNNQRIQGNALWDRSHEEDPANHLLDTPERML